MDKKSLLGAVTLGAMLLSGATVAPAYAAEATIQNEAELKTCLTTTGTTCKLAADVELTAGIAIPEDVETILDLNGFKITYNPAVAGATYALQNAGTLTITDESANADGAIINNAANPDAQTIPGYASNTINNNGDLIVNGGTIENKTVGGAATYAIDTFWYTTSAPPSLTINGGKIVSNSDAIRVRPYASGEAAAFQFKMTGGTIEASCGIWVHLADSTDGDPKHVNIEITGGTINGTDYAIYSSSFGEAYEGVEINIKDGTLNGDIIVGAGSGGENTGHETLNITGGTINGAVKAQNPAGHNISVSGGTFTKGIAEDFLAEGVKTTTKQDGTVLVATPQPEAPKPGVTAPNAGTTTIPSTSARATSVIAYLASILTAISASVYIARKARR